MIKFIHLSIFKSFIRLYKKYFVDSIIIAVAISLGIGFLQSRGLFSPSYWYISTIPVLIYIIVSSALLLIQLMIISGRFRGIVIDTLDAQWMIRNEKGDIASDFKYNISNISDSPVIEFVPDREGFHADIKYLPVYFTSPPNRNIKIRSFNSYKAEQSFHSIMIPTIQYEANLQFNPPIAANESFTLIRQYDVQGSEKNAFTSSGTFFGLRIFFSTNRLLMRMFSPPHYQIEILNYFIGNEIGEMPEKEKKRQLAPCVSSCGQFISWEIMYPKNNYRYWVNYSIRKRE